MIHKVLLYPEIFTKESVLGDFNVVVSELGSVSMTEIEKLKIHIWACCQIEGRCSLKRVIITKHVPQVKVYYNDTEIQSRIALYAINNDKYSTSIIIA